MDAVRDAERDPARREENGFPLAVSHLAESGLPAIRTITPSSASSSRSASRLGFDVEHLMLSDEERVVVSKWHLLSSKARKPVLLSFWAWFVGLSLDFLSFQA
jgi:hypothetical protein